MGKQTKYRIIVADDDAVSRLLMKSVLDPFAEILTLAENGEQVILAIAECDYDFIFMDVHMPIMGGIEAMDIITSVLPPERTPVVFALTASSNNKTIQKCLDAGMSDYLMKPVDIGDLRLIMDRWQSKTPGDKERQNVASDSALLNMARVRELKDLKRSASTEPIVADLIRLFNTECPVQIQQIRLLLEVGNPCEVKEISHKLRGSLINLGLAAAAKLCEQLEEALSDQASGKWKKLLDDLEELYNRSYREFSSYLLSA